MHVRAVAPIAAAVALCLSSLSAMAAEIKPAELLKQAKAEQSAYIATVKQLVAVDTGTGQVEGLATVSQMLVERLQALGAEVSTSPATPSAGDNIVGTLKGNGGKDFLLMVHYDTVFADGTAAERPFRMDEQRAYGPGVADAKGGVAMILHALELLKAQQVHANAKQALANARSAGTMTLQMITSLP